MTAEEAWSAGLIDGEGSIRIKSGSKHLPVISVESTDKDVIERLHLLFNGSVCMPAKRQKHWKQSWVWSVSGENAEHCLQVIYPLLSKRRKQAAGKSLKLWQQHKRKLALPDPRRARALELRQKGLSLRKIAKDVLVCHETVRRWTMPS